MKNRLIKSLVAVLTVLSVFFTTISPIAATAKTAATLEGELIYYFSANDAFRQGTAGASDYTTDIKRTMAELKALDATAAAEWQKIMDEWDYIDYTMTEHAVDVTDLTVLNDVPAGIPDKATHAIVVLGYALNDDGTLKDEAKHRVEVAFKLATKYTNTVVYFTGGGTAAYNKTVTEAGQMADYMINSLKFNSNRVFMENTAKSTVENAQKTIALMTKNGIKTFSMVSSKYHLKRGSILFYSESLVYAALNKTTALEMVVEGNAGWLRTDKLTEGVGMESSALAQIMGVTVPGGRGRPGEVVPEAPKQSVLDAISASGTTSYKYGAKLSLKINASYTNEDYVDATSNPTGAVDYKRDVTSLATITGFDPKTAGTQTLTITYTENGVTKTITMDVTVAAKVPDTGDAQIGYLAGWSALMAVVAAAIVVLKRRKAVEY